MIADGKRGDIDVSARAYAGALLGGIDTPFGKLDGLQADAPCDLVILLNPDTVVQPGWWEPLLRALENPGVGAAACL